MNSQAQVTVIESDKILSAAANGIKRFAKRHYIISSMYVFGLIVALLGSGYSVDSRAAAAYETKMNHAHHVTSHELIQTFEQLKRAENLYYQHKGWFSCDDVCSKYYERVQMVKDQLSVIKGKRDSLQLDAKQSVGAWSVYGIADLRKGFWEAWEQGKEAAKRMTMFDALFITLGAATGTSDNRDNSFLWTLFQIAIQFLMNLTIGLFTSLVVFLFEAWYIITSYGPSILSAAGLFFLVVCSASAVVVTAIGGVFGGLTGSVYYIIRNAEKRARLESRRPTGGQRLHWE